MVASKTSSLESVELLLNNNVDVNAHSKTGKNALAYAIKAKNLEIIKLLSSRTTQEGFYSCIDILSESNIDIINKDGNIVTELEAVVNKIISSSQNMKNKILSQAAIFGNGNLTNFLLNISGISWSDDMIQISVTNAILSDNVACCQVLKNYCKVKGINCQARVQVSPGQVQVRSRLGPGQVQVSSI